jgi:hypothetical protein
VQYCQPYIRPIESQILAVDPRKLDGIHPRIVEMMGYKHMQRECLPRELVHELSTSVWLRNQVQGR